MPRKFVPIVTNCPYHLTARCINREWFKLPMNFVWGLMCDYLYLTAHCFELRVQSFVLMNNHFHLIAKAPRGNLSEAMGYFMRETSRNIGRASGRINQVWGGPYHKSLLSRPAYQLHAYKYVYRNPIEAGLAMRAEDYPFSTLSCLIGRSICLIPAVDEFLFDDLDSRIAWINAPYKEDHREQIRKALRRSSFQLSKPQNKDANELETLPS